MVKVPKQKGQTREVDMIFFDENEGVALYIEVKYFYNPLTINEKLSVDKELQKAQTKISKQVNAIESDWENVSKKNGFKGELKRIYGMIVSYEYLGLNVSVDPTYPLINNTLLNEGIGIAKSLEELYFECKDVEDAYKNIKIIESPLTFRMGEYTFTYKAKCFNPEFEMLLKQSQRVQAINVIKLVNDLGARKAIKDLNESVEILLNAINTQ